MTNVTIEEISSRSDKEKFINLPYRLRANYPNWVLPLRLQMRELLNTKKHPFFDHANMRLFLARRGREVVGRIAVIENALHNETHNENVVHFGFFDCAHDFEAAAILFEKAEEIGRSTNAHHIRGPFNHSVHEEIGLQIDGFDKNNFVMIPGNPDYYVQLLEKCGYQKRVDLYCFRFPLQEFSERVLRVAPMVQKRLGLKVRALSKRTLEADIQAIHEIYNDEWIENWPWTKITQKEMDLLAENLLQIADLEFALLVTDQNDVPVGFSLAIPNINEILIKNKSGRLLPTGLPQLIWGLKRQKIRSFRVLAMGVKNGWRNKGVDAVMHYHQQNVGKRKNVDLVELSQVLETNTDMIAVGHKVGGKIEMTHRIYEKQI